MEIKYTDLESTTEHGAVCRPCSEYKGMVDCPRCGDTFCLYCCDGYTPCCSEQIVY